MNQKSSIMPVALTIVLSAIVFIWFGYYLGSNKITGTAQNGSTISTYATPKTESSIVPSSSPTSSLLQTYDGTSYTVNYPKGWVTTLSTGSVKSDTVTFAANANDQWQLTIQVDASSKTLAQLTADQKAERGQGGVTAKDSATTIGGVPAMKISLSAADGLYGDTLYTVVNGGKAYIISQGKGTDVTTKAIIDSLKFK